MMHFNTILIGYLLVSQASVDATIDIIYYTHMITGFRNRDATIIDGYIEGYIELARPPDACTEIANPVVPKGLLKKRMVLINGTSECDFMSKIQNAKAVGYEVAVLFDPFPEPFNYTNMIFPIPSSEINMTVVLVSCKDGIDIRTNYLYAQSSDWKYVIAISPTIWRTTMGYVFAISIFAVIGIFFCVLLYRIVKKIWKKFCMESYWNEGEETDVIIPANLNFEREEMSERSLSILNTRFSSKVFSTGDSFPPCAICLNDFQVGELYRKLNCNHAYHTDCIDDWLCMKRLCPLCKKKVNLENSTELPPSSASDITPLLASTSDPSSAVQNTRLSNLSSYQNNSSSNVDRFRSHLVEVVGSVNSGHENDW